MNKIALIGDIVQSRDIEDRAATQSALGTILNELNKFMPALLSPYTITLGDEFQCLAARAEGLFQGMLRILIALHPHEIRFSLGIGDLVTDINPRLAIGMDGPAFYRARDTMDELKKSRSLIAVAGLPAELAELVNPVLAMVSHARRDWNLNQYHILLALMRGEPVNDTAERLGISKQAVYKSNTTHGMEAIAKTLFAIERIIDANLGKDPTARDASSASWSAR